MDAAANNNKAVAIPFVLNNACLNGTIANKAIMAISCNRACAAGGIFLFFDKLKCLGNKLVVASGQILRHNPVATTSKAGATGINIFQKTNSPKEGKYIRLKKIPSPINQTNVCTMRQMVIDRFDNPLPD